MDGLFSAKKKRVSRTLDTSRHRALFRCTRSRRRLYLCAFAFIFFVVCLFSRLRRAEAIFSNVVSTAMRQPSQVIQYIELIKADEAAEDGSLSSDGVIYPFVPSDEFHSDDGLGV